MAWQYWDYGQTASTTTGDYSPLLYSGTTSSSDNYYTIVCTRRYLVPPPEHWGDPEIAGFVRLVNDETRTGFIVEMVIKGDVLITDPSIDVRSMSDFVPLLKSRASAQDRHVIDEFFKRVPAIKPEPVAP